MTPMSFIARTSVVLCVTIFLTLALYWQTISSMVIFWMSDDNPTYSHGWLLVLVITYMIYERRRHYLPKGPSLNFSWIGLVLIVICSLVWLFAHMGGIQVVQFLMVVGIIGSVFWALLGFHQARVFIFPLALLLGGIPLWDPVAVFLQHPTAVAAEMLLKISSIPVLREGEILYIPSGTFEVAPACSGLRYLLVAVLLGLIFSGLNNFRWPIAAIIFVITASVAIISNILRVYGVILIGHFSGMESSLVEDHSAMGWVIFVIFAAPLFWWGAKYLPVMAPSAVEAKVVRKVSVAPVLLVAMAAGLLVGPVWALVIDKHLAEGEKTPLLPQNPNNFIQTARSDMDYGPAFLAGDIAERTVYRSTQTNGIDVEVFAFRFLAQNQGKEAVNGMNQLADGIGWFESGAWIEPVSGKPNADVMKANLVSIDGRKLRVWQWYRISDRCTGDPIKAKLFGIAEALKGNTTVDVYVIATPLTDDALRVDQELESVFSII